MNKIINLSLKEKKILKLERVISDLRRGFPVIYNSGKVKWLFLATEFLNNESYSLISGDPFNLTLSDSRLNYLKIGDNTKHGFLSISQKPIATIQDLVFNIKAPDSNLEIDFTESEDIDNIHKFLIELEIVPSICFVPVESYDPELLEVDSELIGSYAKLIVEKLCFVTETNLHLSAVRPIKIRAYNSKFGGKDHYAIIVGNPELDASPLVRIHSSCYTGDLLGSLSCDCGDQLKLALKTMDESTEFHGGILIYLMQEEVLG
jgi:GTP cyclohydrolase II